MPRYAFCIILACLFGACEWIRDTLYDLDASSQSPAVTMDTSAHSNQPRLTMEMTRAPPSDYVCNNDTFDWVVQTFVSKIAQLTEVLQSKEEEIGHLKQGLEAERKTNEKLQEQYEIQQKQFEKLRDELENQREESERERDAYESYVMQIQERYEEQLGQRQGIDGALPVDCADIERAGHAQSGVYTVYPRTTASPPSQHRANHVTQCGGEEELDIYHRQQGVAVWCDLDSAGGHWLVIQRRHDGRQAFNNTWLQYKRGFGLLHEDFWLGNGHLHSITQQRLYELRVDLGLYNGSRYTAHYDYFRVAPESDNFRLHLGAYSGDAGDSLRAHHEMQFTTLDNDHDQSRSINCAAWYGGGGWWYERCYDSNLNGQYTEEQGKQGIVWFHINEDHTPLSHVTMMIRPKHYT